MQNRRAQVYNGIRNGRQHYEFTSPVNNMKNISTGIRSRKLCKQGILLIVFRYDEKDIRSEIEFNDDPQCVGCIVS